MKRSTILIFLAFGDIETKQPKIERIRVVTRNLSGQGLNTIISQAKPLMLSHTPVGLRTRTKPSTRWQLTYWEPPLNWEYVYDGEDTGKTLRTWHTLN